MKGAVAIWKREMLSLFVTPVAYGVVAACSMLAAYFFFSLLEFYHGLIQQYRSLPLGAVDRAPQLHDEIVRPYLQMFSVILIFIAPILTMRLFPEERKSGTFDYLFISSISSAAIVTGKYLAAASVLLTVSAAVAAFPLALALYTESGLAPALSGALGLFLFALAAGGLSLAVSSFCRSPIVSAVSGIVVLLMWYMLHSPAELLSGSAARLLSAVSPAVRVNGMLRGYIATDDLAYFISIALFGLIFSATILQYERE